MEPDRLHKLVKAQEVIDEYRKRCPSLFYKPHGGGQVQFHSARQVVRAMFPGNGWGKTRAMGTEAAWWIDHAHPYQETPDWPCIVIWFCTEFRQFELLRTQLEGECLSRGWNWNEQKHRYRWPNGAEMYVASYDRSWTHLQGINPDLICFDEMPPLALWREMLQRRRGKRKTRFVVAATATEGETWAEPEIFKPWQTHHEAEGLSIDQAREAQTHEWYWVWEHGGIDDNPGADAGDRKWYHSRTWSSAEEKRVRLFGGFGSYNGMPVFDPEALNLAFAALAKGRLVSLVVKHDRSHAPSAA
jgi:hypothetical protein